MFSLIVIFSLRIFFSVGKNNFITEFSQFYLHHCFSWLILQLFQVKVVFTRNIMYCQMWNSDEVYQKKIFTGCNIHLKKVWELTDWLKNSDPNNKDEDTCPNVSSYDNTSPENLGQRHCFTWMLSKKIYCIC